MSSIQASFLSVQVALAVAFMLLMLIRYCVRFFKKSKEEPGDFTGCLQFVAGLFAVVVVILMVVAALVYIIAQTYGVLTQINS